MIVGSAACDWREVGGLFDMVCTMGWEGCNEYDSQYSWEKHNLRFPVHETLTHDEHES